MGCSCQTNNKHVFGVGKVKWWMLEGDISSMDRNSVNLQPYKCIPTNYSPNPKNIYLPILQTL
jgi:hypothetical protein